MSEHLGIGVMLSHLGGNRESVEAFSVAVGKKIASISIVPGGPNREPDALRIEFDDATVIEFYDDGQSCCEHRYMKCDDDFPTFIGATLLNTARIASGPKTDTGYEVKECAFLIVGTSAGEFTVANYNEHNGYYGGFSVRCRASK